MSAEESISDVVSNLYVMPVAAWALGLLFMFALGDTGYAIGWCYPLALWWIGVSIWWLRKSHDDIASGKRTRDDVAEGVEWIGHTLAGVSGAPAIIFLAAAPLQKAAWATTGSCIIVCVLTYGAVSALSRQKWTGAHTVALVIACLAMPLNASTAISLGWWLGLIGTVSDVAHEVVPI